MQPSIAIVSLFSFVAAGPLYQNTTTTISSSSVQPERPLVSTNVVSSSASLTSTSVPQGTPGVFVVGRPVVATSVQAAARPAVQTGLSNGSTNLVSFACIIIPSLCKSTTSKASSSAPVAIPTSSSSTLPSSSNGLAQILATSSSSSSSILTTSSPSSSTTTSSSTTKSSTTSSSSTTKSSSTSSSSSSTKQSTTTKVSSSSTSAAAPTQTVNLNGCYVDSTSSRSMTGASTSGSNMTPQVCAAFCTANGFAYSGTEYGSECYCDTKLPSTWSLGCNMRCAGDSTQFCGGGNALNTLYTAPVATAGTISTKRGLCWPWDNKASVFSLFNPAQETWLYNWELWSPAGGTSYASAQYVGIVRSPDRLTQLATYYRSDWQTSPYLMGFNEPDLPGDTFVTVADALTYWQQYFLPIRKQYGTILGAPAVTNGVGTNWGIDWLNKFNAGCQDTMSTPGQTKSCFDFIPIHWYGSALADFQSYITNFHNAYPSYPIWVTEFAFTGHELASTAAISKIAIEWLDAQSYIQRYSMFGPMEAARMAGITGGAMVSDDLSSLTVVGKVYTGQA